MGIKTIKAKSLKSKTTSAPKSVQKVPRPGEVVRVDSWENVVSGLNILGTDKRLYATPSLNLIDWSQAEILWRSDDMAARVIEIVPYEETREGFELCADETEGEEDAADAGAAEQPTDNPLGEDPEVDPNAEPGDQPAPSAPPEKTEAPAVADPKTDPKADPALADPKADPTPQDPEVDPTDPLKKKKLPFKKDEAHVDAAEHADFGFGKPKKKPIGSVPPPADPNAAEPDPAEDPNADPEAKPAPEAPNPEASKVDPAKGAPAKPSAPAFGAKPAAKPGMPAKPPPGVPKVKDKKKDDPLEQLENMLIEDLDILAKTYEVRTYSRGFGGGAWLLGADDGQRDMSKPLVPERVRKFDWVNVLHPRELQPATWYGDPTAPKYGEIETYYLSPDSIDGQTRMVGTQIIHESRIVRFEGVVVSRQHRRENLNGWGDSILTRVYEVIRDFQSTWGATGVLMQDFAQTIFKMKGLADLVASEDPDDANRFRARVRAIDYSRSVTNSVLLDADGEDFERKTTTVTGLPDLLDKFAARLAAAVDIPVTRLMGQSPAGLNATGASDIRFFYDQIKAGQVRHLSKAIKRVAQLKATAMGLKLPEKWSVKWKPLWQLDEVQEATRRKLIVDMAVAAIGAQMITPEEAAVSLFGSETFSAEIKLSTDDRSVFAAERQAADQEASQMNLEAAKAGGGKPGFGGKPGGFGKKKVLPPGKPPSDGAAPPGKKPPPFGG